MVREILDLHGNKFKIQAGNFKLCLEIPKGQGEFILTRDIFSGDRFILRKHGNKYTGYFYNLSMNLHIRYRLKYLGYDESSDLRKAYLYGKRR